ncbi:MAG: LemA family protein [Azoarcus sp.]|jgi:LemA protein|nr:LemA family protein [Azoarcus sp.]
MEAILGFLKSIFWIGVLLVLFLVWRYNGLRRLSEAVKEAWSNIGVTIHKQASLTNQLIDAVKSYADTEKFVMLSVHQDNTLIEAQRIHQQSSQVLTAVNALAQRFPDLKQNTQYLSLMAGIKEVENKLESQREKYNAAARTYNVLRTSVPDLFYAQFFGFKVAPYLDFDGASEQDFQSLKTLVSDDGERLNQLLSSAGDTMRRISQQVGAAALDHSRQIASTAQEKVRELQQSQQEKAATGWHLLGVGGSLAGKTFPLREDGQVLGSADSAEIVVKDTGVAERHLWIGRENDRWLLRDLDTRQGTFLDQDPDSSISEIELAHDLTLHLGRGDGARFRIVAG